MFTFMLLLMVFGLGVFAASVEWSNLLPQIFDISNMSHIGLLLVVFIAITSTYALFILLPVYCLISTDQAKNPYSCERRASASRELKRRSSWSLGYSRRSNNI